MPQNKNSEPPKVMTWPKASLVLVFAVAFDLLRAFFNLFWFFGPAIAALYCSSKVSGWVGSMWGLTDAACNTAAVAAGIYFSPVIASFGVIMADAVALLGYLFLTLLVLMTNARILKTVQTAMMQIGASFGVAALPLIGAIPTFTITLSKLYRRQIKLEEAAYRKWEKTHANEQVQQRQERAAQLMQSKRDQVAQDEPPQRANDEMSVGTEQEKKPREVVSEEETYEPPTAQGVQQPEIVPSYTGTSDVPASSPQKHYGTRDVSIENKKVDPSSRKRKFVEGTYTPAPTRTVQQLATVPNYTETGEANLASTQKPPEAIQISIAKKVEPASIPQEEVIKKTAVLAEGSVGSSYVAPPSVMKTKESTSPGPTAQTYEQGIERLRKDLLSAGNEHTEMFVVKKDGTSSWLKVPENASEKLKPADVLPEGSAPTQAKESASEKFIKSIADDETVDRFDIVHIRPSPGVSHDSNRVSQTQKEESVPLATPPNISDLVDMVTVGEGGDKASSRRPGTIVVDPTGVWKAELVGDPKILLSAKQKPQVSETPSISDFISKIEMLSSQNIVLDTDEKLKEMQDIYSGVGVNLTFIPHPKESGDEIPEEVREAM